MIKPYVIFSHGKESGPSGRKITMLADIARSRGLDCESIDYRDLVSPEDRVSRLVTRCSQVTAPLLLVGSSMGGYVSAVAASRRPVEGLFLMAPAIGLADYAEQSPKVNASTTFIVAAWGDDIIPPENIFAFAGEMKAELLFLDADHRLDSRLSDVARHFESFLRRVAPA